MISFLRLLPDLVLVVLTALWIALRLFTPSEAPTPAQQCGFTEADLVPQPIPDVITLEVWATAGPPNCMRAFIPLLAARQVKTPPLGLRLRPFNVTGGSRYDNELEMAVQRNAAPDIVLVPDWKLRDYAQRGWLLPLDECRARHEEFTQVYPDLWSAATWEGQTWGVPLDFDLELFFFNKDKLRQLGWSELRVAALPEQIATGAFTLDDMLATARQAMTAGVIEPNFGYWPNYGRWTDFWLNLAAYGEERFDTQGRLTISHRALAQSYRFYQRLFAEDLSLANIAGRADFGAWPNGALWRESTAHNRVLFWTGSARRWTDWRNLVDEAVLQQRIGVALYPTGQPGGQGRSMVATFDFYVLFAKATDSPLRRRAACALLAQTVTPTVNAQQTLQRSTLGVVKEQEDVPAYASLYHRLIAPLRAAKTRTFTHPQEPRYATILRDFLGRVELGDLTPEVAASAAIDQLKAELGDELLIRP